MPSRSRAGPTSYVALLRAVNVGGTGKLPMADLKRMCEEIGLGSVRTYIASGNVLFESQLSEAKVRAAIEARLREYAGKPVDVAVRTVDEMAAVLRANPFCNKAPNATVAVFLNEAPPEDTLDGISGQRDEEVRLGGREIYVYYGSGMGQSKLKIAAAGHGTARNMNTVAKLAAMASGDA